MTGPSDSRCVEDRGSPAGAARRQSYGCPRDHADHAVDATTRPSDSRCVEDSGIPDCAVHRQSRGSTWDHADAPVPHVAGERTSERTQIVSAPVPQSLEEVQELLSTPQFQEHRCSSSGVEASSTEIPRIHLCMITRLLMGKPYVPEKKRESERVRE